MEIIFYGEPTGNNQDNFEMMGRKRRCTDCDCDDNDCFDCSRYGYCDDDCGCDDGADCYYDD